MNLEKQFLTLIGIEHPTALAILSLYPKLFHDSPHSALELFALKDLIHQLPSHIKTDFFFYIVDLIEKSDLSEILIVGSFIALPTPLSKTQNRYIYRHGSTLTGEYVGLFIFPQALDLGTHVVAREMSRQNSAVFLTLSESSNYIDADGHLWEIMKNPTNNILFKLYNLITNRKHHSYELTNEYFCRILGSLNELQIATINKSIPNFKI